MKTEISALCAMSVAALALGTAAAQEAKKTQPAAPQAQQGPPMPKPGPEHAVLKSHEGTWDASVESWMEPGKPPTVSKGTDTSSMALGGLWLVTDFKGDFMGQVFQGHGVMGYDPGKKKYVGTWVDSMSPGLAMSEGTYDPASKTLTEWMEGPDMSGKIVKSRSVTEWKDADTRVWTMYITGPDGKELPSLRITYKRRK